MMHKKKQVKISEIVIPKYLPIFNDTRHKHIILTSGRAGTKSSYAAIRSDYQIISDRNGSVVVLRKHHNKLRKKWKSWYNARVRNFSFYRVWTVAYVPYLYNMEVTEDGTILSGQIGIDYVSAGNIYLVSWNNGRVTECIFTFPKTVNRKKYVQVQHHKIGADMYVIENTVLECLTGSREGRELTLAEWKQIRPFATLAPRMETHSPEPQFVIDRLNIVNNADEDESNPMGVAIFANSIDVLKKIDIEYDSYSSEFELGRKRIFVAPEMLKNVDGSPAFDPEDTGFYRLPDDYDKGKEGLIHEIDMDLRADLHSKAINDDLNYLSLKCGFGTERTSDRQDVSMGAMSLWEYRMKYYGETGAQAKAAVQQPAEVIE
ncbi:hypothetical protein MCG98_15410 [Ruminococcus sp. OA3]|uniref:hypothetical protein n=1 Tax=Ruminococcus sp. OA3 TaxID=2914164 RepID=UPI001F057B03|nr:hypothetical protein [Ruminococcus sp. OA3]MCH1983957.1 hypothetical protein [Ruminococcus sp. OA3]